MVDARFQGRRGIIGVGVLAADSGRGIALVDPGPETCLPALRQGLAALGRSLADVRAILLTHIHLDHATAAGAIVREAPGAEVCVHAAGAPHMADPQRLLASAGRIYGDRMAELWGEFVPVPRDALRVVDEGDAVEVGGRALEVAYVPGHARHHVAYLDVGTGTAWVGDVGGIRLGDGPPLPVTPPPDIDVGLWKAGMARVMEWGPERIVATHYGPYRHCAAHFEALGGSMDRWARWVKESLDDPSRGTDSARARAFADRVADDLGRSLTKGQTALYRIASSFTDSWWGLARYWRKRGR